MNKQLPDQTVQQDIYLALKDSALVRHSDARKLVHCRGVVAELVASGDGNIQSLVTDYTAEIVALMIHSLVNGKCFDSVKKAHDRFPSLLGEHVASTDPEQGRSKEANTSLPEGISEEPRFVDEDQEEDVFEPWSHSRL